MKRTDKVVVLITAASEEEAQKIADALVNEKKAACVNIVPRVDSLFCWQGKIESARESLLLAKTRASLFPEIVSLVKEIHSYEVPEIIALPIVAGSEDYLNWLDIACQWRLAGVKDDAGDDNSAPTGSESQVPNPKQCQMSKPKSQIKHEVQMTKRGSLGI